MATPNFKSSYENKYGPSVLLLRRKVIRPKTPASFVSSSLTNRVSLLSLSDKSTVDVVGNLDVDYATRSFCSSCAIPPRVVGGLWSDGVGCDMCCRCYPYGVLRLRESG